MTETTVGESAEMKAAVAFYKEHSTVKKEGLREVRSADFAKRMEEAHGITKAEYRKFSDALKFETSAAGRLAADDLVGLINAASKEDLAKEEFVRGMSSTVRLPTNNGATEVEVYAEKISTIPVREGQPEDAPTHKITHGRIRVGVKTKNYIDTDLINESRDAVRKALGIKD